MSEGGWRLARHDEAGSLSALERDANLVGLAHVFPAEEHPFPEAAVLYRWEMTLTEPEVVVEVLDGEEPGELAAFVAYDRAGVRHLAVRPSAWGRGLGTEALQRAVRAVAPGRAALWVLEDNRRARRLYERLGWTATGQTQPCPWAPHPLELQYRSPGPAPSTGDVSDG
jgi:GNAT superfamily N-acetyltransferase